MKFQVFARLNGTPHVQDIFCEELTIGTCGELKFSDKFGRLVAIYPAQAAAIVLSTEATDKNRQSAKAVAVLKAAMETPMTPRLKKIMSLGVKAANDLKHSYFGPEHVLLGMIQEGESGALTVLGSYLPPGALDKLYVALKKLP